MTANRGTHEARRKRWLAMAPAATRALAADVDAFLVPLVREAGFGPPDIVAGDRSLRVSGRTIDLWRLAGTDCFQFIQFDFDKYRAPRFQVRFGELMRRDGRWSGQRSASLVPRGKRYFHEWGKPRWWPLRLWSDRRSTRICREMAPLIGQILRYFDHGERGVNLGEMVDNCALIAAMQEVEGVS